PRRVDVLPGRDEGGCERPAAARPARVAPRAGCRLSLGGRGARRAPVTTPTRQAAALVALGTVLLAASYPPFRLPVVSFLAVAPAVVLLRRFESERDPGGAVRWGFWYGFVTQGAVLYWLVVALWHFTPLSALGYLATIAIYGLWYALMFRFVVALRMRLPRVPLWVVFPVAWTTVEWVVGHQGKWAPRHSASVVRKLVTMSRALEARGPLDLLLWPEAAIPGWLAEMPAWDTAFAALAREGRTPILTGGIHAVRSDVYYNAAFFYDSTGQWRTYPVYGKHYLVPVVERVPFVPVRLFRSVPGLRQWSGGFSPGPTLPVYQTKIGRLGVVICYESAFEELARAYRRAGAAFLVNITNDAWYGRTAGPYQHASHLVLRAIETRAGIARAANDGISEFVDPLGRTYAATGLEVEGT